MVLRNLTKYNVPSVLLSGWESLQRSLLEAGASRRLIKDIRLAAAALRENILAVGGADTPLDTLDQQDLNTRLHKFRVSHPPSSHFYFLTMRLEPSSVCVNNCYVILLAMFCPVFRIRIDLNTDSDPDSEPGSMLFST